MIVKAIHYRLPPNTIPYIPADADKLRDEFGSALMPMDHATTDRLWILMDDWRCLLELDIGWMEVVALRGWWLDWASIPGMLETVEKRDDRDGLIGATLHDIFFAYQFPFFDTANDLFRQVMRLTGTGRIRAWYKWRCVQSPAGWRAWEASSDPAVQALESRWVRVRLVPEPSYEYRKLIEVNHDQ